MLEFFTPQLIALMIYMMGIGLITWIGYRATNNMSDYILGGRSFGPWVTALSAGSSDMSGWLLMGLPGAIFTYGLSKSWIGIGLYLGAWVNWSFIAGRLREQTQRFGDAQTLPEFFANRFASRGYQLRFISSLVIVVFFTFYCASGVVASAKLLQNGFGVDYSYGIWLGALLTVSYVFFGGLFAVSWTDTLQAVLMFLAIILVPCATFFAIEDLVLAGEITQTNKAGFTHIIGDMSILSIMSSMAWGLGYFGQPHILVRFMAAKDSGKTMKQAKYISLCWMLLCLMGSLAIGYFGALYLCEMNYATGFDSETIFLVLGKLLLNPWLSGFLIAAIFSAIMSTLSSQLLIGSASLISDILPYVTKKRLDSQEAVLYGRIGVVVIAFIAIMIAADPQSSILSMVGYAWAGFGCAFGTVILMALLWDKMTSAGALSGMITGGAVVILWEIFGSSDIYSMIPGFMSAIAMIIIVSKFSVFFECRA